LPFKTPIGLHIFGYNKDIIENIIKFWLRSYLFCIASQLGE